MSQYHGKREWEYYEDGRKEIGHCVYDNRQGEFEFYDQSGTLTHRKIYKDGKVIECEELKH